MPTGGAKRSGRAAQTDSDVEGDGLRREHVSEIQRARILAATFEVCGERGASGLTVALIVARAGVSRRTFYELFSSREDCFLAAFDDAIARIAAVVVPAYEQPSKWRERIRASLTALLQFLDDEPGTGRLVVVEALGAGANALERRSRVLAQVITAVDRGRSEAKKGNGPPPLTAEGLAGAVLSVIHARMLAGDRRPLVELVNPLMFTIVLPYLGAAAARRELTRPVPKAPARPRPVNGDPLRELQMRLTYRTVRVLMAVAANPGSSNRTVADGAGIKDQGQISKLLHRLERLGLIGNDGAGRPLGGPNAWTLTERGAQIEHAIRESSRAASQRG
jgi:AcrR family transcriptional regulator